MDADLSLLTRVISNLLENEIAHVPSGCQIYIRLRSRQGAAELAIEDNGPGFPPEIAGRACERFVKGKNSTGHGLGLAFVDAVIQAHGGSVQVRDRVGGGALLMVSLPVACSSLYLTSVQEDRTRKRPRDSRVPTLPGTGSASPPPPR